MGEFCTMERTLTNKAATCIDMEATMQKIFNVFDTDGDGTLDKQEITNFAKAFIAPTKGHQSKKSKASLAHQDNVDKIMAAMDFQNGDGRIQLEELTAYFEAVLNAKFVEYDSSHDGGLTIDEMTKVVDDLCHSKRDEAQRKKSKAHYVQNKKKWFMKQFDKDHGGNVSAFEFQAYFLRTIDAELNKWKPGQELPYCLRAAVNVNPGQIHAKVKEIEAIEEKRVEKAKAAGVYIPPHEDEFHLDDVTDKEVMTHYEAPQLSEAEKANREELVKEAARKAEAKEHELEEARKKIHATHELRVSEQQREAERVEERDARAGITNPITPKQPIKAEEDCAVCQACSIM